MLPLSPRSVRSICVLVVASLVAACSAGDESSSGTVAQIAVASPSTTAPTTTASSTVAPIASTPPTAAPSTEPAIAAFDFSVIDPIVQEFVDGHDLNGAGLVIVDRDLGVIGEQYWGEFGPDRISLVASSSKMVTAGVLLRLQDDGLLDIDAPIADSVDWAAGVGNDEITVAQLLSNSSGLVGLIDDPSYGPYICQFLAVGTLQACGETIVSTPDDDADIQPPDTVFRYGGAQWQVAGAVAEAVSGRSWAELIDQIYTGPCDLDSLAYNNQFTQLPSGFSYPFEFDDDPSVLQPTDNPNMEGGMYTDPRDYASLLLMHLRGGTCGGERVLSQSAIDLMHADRIGTVYGGSTFTGSGYGMGWWVDRETGRVSDAGAYGSVPWLDLADGYGAYLVIEATSTLGAQLASELYDPVEQAVSAGR